VPVSSTAVAGQGFSHRSWNPLASLRSATILHAAHDGRDRVERSKDERFYHFPRPALAERAKASAGEANCSTHRPAPRPVTLAASTADEAPRGTSRPASSQWSTLPASGASDPAMSLSASMPTHGNRPGAENAHVARLSARPATACGLCATSRTIVGRPGKNLKAPGKSSSISPRRTRLHRNRQPRSEQVDDGERGAGIAQLAGAAQTRIRQAAAPQPPRPRRSIAAGPRNDRNRGPAGADRRRSPARASSDGGGSGSAQSAGRPARKMPAFSKPIDSRVGPSQSV
jgi:hypothetical protein